MQEHMVIHLVVAWAAAMAAIALGAEVTSPNPARVDALAKMLPESPRGVGPTIGDRQAWGPVARDPRFQTVVTDAVSLIGKPFPELSDAFFSECATARDRKRCGPILGDRRSRFARLTLAECIENRGRFLPAIETAIQEACSETSWMHPAHDHDLLNVQRKVVEIDLNASALAWNLATAAYWLGDKLSPETRKLLGDELERRIFRPFTGMVTEGKPRPWWLKGTSNWNAVCLAGVTGTALAAIEERRRRAWFLAAMETAIRNFISGFTDRGFCSEGVGYWCYGFGNYVKLAETVYQATDGRMDMFSGEKVGQIAQFARRMEILPGVYPAFADCDPAVHPNARLMAFLSRRFGMGLRDVEAEGLLLAAGPTFSLPDLGLFGLANSATRRPASDSSWAGLPLRDWFPVAGLLICRPASGREHALGAALKGGHNAEHHNHNDVGSFVVALGKSVPLIDPGAENYYERTFGPRRYESNVLNSYGHSVPRVAGTLQKPGKEFAAKVVRTVFTHQEDTLVLDIRAAYDVKPLRKLLRTFVFSRQGAGCLTVVDEVEFETPQSFGTALVTFYPHRTRTENELFIGEGRVTVRADVTVEGSTLQVRPEQIKEDLPGGQLPTRIGLDLSDPVTKGKITVRIRPAG
ncbi:MAG: heparinase II/III family protein [Phycisphaerae bacterium]|nr:heparinase II/III family protein [Phycisphaerae bacterium]